MARLITFRSQVAECLEEGDALKFQDIFKQRLLESYYKQQRKIVQQIVEQEDPEMKMVTTIETASKSFGGHGFIYDQGLLGILVPQGASAEGFAKYLDESDDVEDYEDTEIELPVTSESPTDLEGGKGRIEVHFSINLNQDNILEFTGHQDLEESKKPCKEEEDPEEDEDEDLEESKASCDDEEDPEEEDDEEDEDEMNESNHPTLVRRLNAFINKITPIEINEASKIVAFRHTDAHSNVIQKLLKLPPRPGFKIVNGGYERISAQAKRNMMKGQIAGARKRELTQKKATKRRQAALTKRAAAGY